MFSRRLCGSRVLDPELTAEIGRALAREALAEDVQVVLGPAINIKRSPLCGRNFEYYSEDPYLAGKLAASYIRAMQAEDVAVSLKHYAVNSQEYRRRTSSAELSERALREIYLSNFEIAVKEGAPYTVMCSYNRVNGTHVSESKKLLTDILRFEWGFDGVVMSDWGAVNDRALGLAAGMDLEMPSSYGATDQVIREALEDGRLSEADLDTACRRLLKLVQRTAEDKSEELVFDREKDHELACDLAARCLVLLKNDTLIPEGGDESIYLDGNPEALLPLDKDEKIAFIGAMAETPRYQGGGSSHVRTKNVSSALEAARRRCLDSLDYAPGYRLSDDLSDEELLAEAEETAREADIAVVFIGLSDAYESEGYDREHLDLPESHNALLRRVLAVQPRTVVVLHNGSPVLMPWIEDVPAVLENYIAGEGVGEATVRVLFGEVNPSGRLPESFPKRLEQTPCYGNFPGYRDEVHYAEDVYVGYRYYSTHKSDILFPFGHGLSYTRFDYENLRVSQKETGADEQLSLELSVDVINSGDRAGETVVQLYVSPQDTEARVGRPVRELKGFKKIYLEAGERKTCTLPLNFRSFAYYDEDKGEWTAAPGSYALEICRNAAEVIVSETVRLKAGFKRQRVVTKNTCMGDLENCPLRLALFIDYMCGFNGLNREENERRFYAQEKDKPLRNLRGYLQRFSEENLNELIALLNDESCS